MITDFEEEYLKYNSGLKEQQWGNYFEGANYDLSLGDEEIYRLVNRYLDKIETFSRKGKIIEIIIYRELVEKNPVVSKLRNYIDNLDNYSQDLPEEIHGDKERLKICPLCHKCTL